MDKNKYLNFEGLEKYDKLIKSYIALNNKTLVDNIDTLNVDVAALKSIDHDAYISADKKLEQSIKDYTDVKIETKQDKIEDLESIRSGAALGATAVQQIPSEYITETELADKEYATTSQVENLIDDAVVVATDDEIDNLFKI